MTVEMVLVAGIVALVVAGAVTSIVLVSRASSPERGPEADPMSPRLSCEAHTGEEQLLIHLVRSLGLPTSRDGVGYGEVYVAASPGTTIRLATRSEIGRGFDGEIRVQRTRRASVAEYFVLRLPGDETVLRRIARLDDEIVLAVRSLDPQAVVRRAAGPDRRLGMEPTTR